MYVIQYFELIKMTKLGIDLSKLKYKPVYVKSISIHKNIAAIGYYHKNRVLIWAKLEYNTNMTESDLIAIEQQVAKIINDHLILITVDAKGLAEARARSAKFLVAQSILSTFLKTFEDDISRSSTIKDAQFAQGIASVDGKTITEKKANLALYQDYSNAREFNEKLGAFKDWIKTHMKIFENAHLMFRQYARD